MQWKKLTPSYNPYNLGPVLNMLESWGIPSPNIKIIPTPIGCVIYVLSTYTELQLNMEFKD